MIVNIPGQYRMISMDLTPVGNKYEVRFPFDLELKDEIKSWEGAAWKPEKRCWVVANSPRNQYCLKLLTERKDPRYHDPFTLQELRDKCHFLDLRPELMSHQRHMVEEALGRRRVIWAAEPGLGKTLAAIEVMEYTPGLFWIICPRSAKDVWQHELRKWPNSRKEYDGTNRKNGYQIVPMHKIVSMVQNIMAMPDPSNWLPNHLIVDEIHFFKNDQAQRTQALFSLANLLRKVSEDCVLIGMTGTPAPKDPTDWWSLAEYCQPGFLRESSKKKLQYRLGIHEDMGDFYRLVKWKKDEVEKLYRRLKGMVTIKLAKDCLDLPPIIYTEQRFELTAQVKQLVRHIKDTSSRAITALIRLRQFSDGFQPSKKCSACDGDGQIATPTLPMTCVACDGSGLIGGDQIETPKDEALLEYLQEDRDRIVIYAGFHKSIDKIVRICHEQGWGVIQVDGRGTSIDQSLSNSMARPEDRQNAQAVFAESPDRVAYVGHPTAGGVSITLNKSEIIIFYSNEFNGASRMQAEKRIHRIGTNKATIIDFLWLPTDKLVLDNLRLKKELQSVTMGEINEFWENY